MERKMHYEGWKQPLVFSHQFEWRISDDTQLTLATCESISKTQSVDPQSISETFADWHRSARFTGLGVSTYKALSELCIGGHWALVGRSGERAAGNGAAMRIAPLAFALTPKIVRFQQAGLPKLTVAKVRESREIRHIAV
jgi:ADP-ribosylglycohydrolase